MDLKVQPQFTGRKLTKYEANILINRRWTHPYYCDIPTSSFSERRQIAKFANKIASYIQKCVKFFSKQG